MIKNAIIVFAFLLLTNPTGACATIINRVVEYTAEDNVTLSGYVVYDDSVTTPRPGILYLFDWLGVRPVNLDKMVQLATKGYVVFAADVYGKGIRPADSTEAKTLSEKYLKDMPNTLLHVKAGYQNLLTMPNVDKNKVAIIGASFGGYIALNYIKTGSDQLGTALFHCSLLTGKTDTDKNIRGKLLVMHGAQDPLITGSQVGKFLDDMRNAHVSVKLISYANAFHSFSSPWVGTNPNSGSAYNESVDIESWDDLNHFLEKLFNEKPGKQVSAP